MVNEYNITIGSETNNDSADTHGTFKMKINVEQTNNTNHFTKPQYIYQVKNEKSFQIRYIIGIYILIMCYWHKQPLPLVK